jgi:putative transcriptional regulator
VDAIVYFSVAMQLTPGKILISAPSLDDPNFEKAVILITEHNEKGALGFVLNKLFHRVFNELEEFKRSPPFKLYEGGPMENDQLYFIHQRADLIENGVQIVDSIYSGGNFKQAVTHINNKNINKNEIRLFIGYCGWDYDQLEEEIEEGSWLLADADAGIIFTTDTNTLWDTIYKRF